MKRTFILLPLISFMYLASFSQNQVEPERQWPMYRGYYASGVLDGTDLPDSWNVESNENIAWKVEVPGLGLSSPVIWGDRLYITSAVSEEDKKGIKTGIYGSIGSVKDESAHDWIICCYDKNTGSLLWQQTACTGIPKVKRHPKSTHANSTLATDGKYVVAFFGSEGLYCYDMDGELQWKKDFGLLKSVFFSVEDAEWEWATSPIIHEGVVIAQVDVLENSFIAAYDASSGEQVWKKERDEYPGWCTPNIYYDGDMCRVAVNGFKHRGGYDFETGEEIWKMSGGGDIQVPTPIVSGDLVYFNSAHGMYQPILAIKTSATGTLELGEGEFSGEHIQWGKSRGGSYMQTMLVYNGLLYNVRWNGNVACLDAKTGEEYWREKAGSGNSYISSPVASDGKLYVTDDEGTVYVLEAGKQYKLLAENPLGDICMSTPAITDGMIYFRTVNYLVAVGNQ